MNIMSKVILFSLWSLAKIYSFIYGFTWVFSDNKNYFDPKEFKFKNYIKAIETYAITNDWQSYCDSLLKDYYKQFKTD